jgi:hypothetical protein
MNNDVKCAINKRWVYQYARLIIILIIIQILFSRRLNEMISIRLLYNSRNIYLHQSRNKNSLFLWSLSSIVLIVSHLSFNSITTIKMKSKIIFINVKFLYRIRIAHHHRPHQILPPKNPAISLQTIVSHPAQGVARHHRQTTGKIPQRWDSNSDTAAFNTKINESTVPQINVRGREHVEARHDC